MHARSTICVFRLRRACPLPLAVAAMLALLGLASSAEARVLNLSPDGSSAVLREALASAHAGDTLLLGRGVYVERELEVTVPLTILGQDGPIIDGDGEGEVLRIMADDVTVRGLTIRGAGVSFIHDNAALRIEEVRRCTIENCRFERNFFGIYLAKSADCRLAGNTLTGDATTETRAGNGIHLWYCRDIEVDRNTIRGHRDGIYFEFVRACRITRNTSDGNLRYGLHFMFSDSCLYANNTFERNGAGVAVMYTRQVTMLDNHFIHNWGPASYGLLLKDITDSEVSGNLFRRNTVGIHLEGSNRVRIHDNTFEANGWGVRLMANAIDNVFTRNNFVGNSLAVSTNSRSSFSTFRENFWSDYDGYDLDGDGYGDVPFRPVGLFSLVVEKNPPALVLLRSLLVDVLDLTERLIPTLTPATLIDERPLMQPVS